MSGKMKIEIKSFEEYEHIFSGALNFLCSAAFSFWILFAVVGGVWRCAWFRYCRFAFVRRMLLITMFLQADYINIVEVYLLLQIIVGKCDVGMMKSI